MKRSFSLLLAALALEAFLLPSAEAMATSMLFNRDDTEEGAERNCKLLGPFALFIQAIMGVVVVGSLVLKRQREKPKRPWKIWLLDISKQMLGQLFVHILNVVLSWLGSIASAGEDNPCSLYFMNIAIDTTLGVLFIYYSMRYLTHFFTDVLGWPGFVSGQYTTTPPVLGRRRRGGPRAVNSASSDADQARNSQQEHEATHSSSASPQIGAHKSQRPRISFFFRQLSIYLFSLFLMKVMVVVVFAILPSLSNIGRWVLERFGDDRRAQVFFVMALFPLAMNTVQFWLIDSVLRHNPQTSRYASQEDLDGAEYSQDMERSQASFDWGDTGHPPSPSGNEDESSLWSLSWWKRLLHLTHENDRGMYHEIANQSAPFLQDTDGAEREEQHMYPPPSASSSVAQLDVSKAKGNGDSRVKNKDTAYGSLLRSPPLLPQPNQAATAENNERSVEPSAPHDDMDEAWDVWDDDNDKSPSHEQSMSTESLRMHQRQPK